MKKKHSISDFSRHRADFLMTAFRDALVSQTRIDRKQIFGETAMTPAPRFWVSENRAAYIVGQYILGNNPLEKMYPEKRRMYEEILRRFFILRADRPLAPMLELVAEIVNSPAPGSFISPARVESIILREKRRRRGGGAR